MGTTGTKAESLSISDLMTGYVVAQVPIYQRSYKWDSEELEEFWSDLQSVFGADGSTHFIGSIVLIQKADGNVEIVDGQQRLTTLSLALCALRDGCESVGDTERATLLGEYLGKKHFRTLKTSPKLTLNEENEGLYRKILDRELTREDLEKYAKTRANAVSNRRLASAYRFFYGNLEVATAKFTDKDKLYDCLAALVDRVEAVRILSPDDVSAYTLFETMNDRGVNLALADLLKNYLFMQTGNRVEEAKAAWYEVSSLVGRENVTQFIRHQWMSRNGLIRERDLYRKLKARITTQALAVDYLDEIRQDAAVYSQIDNIHSPVWANYSRAGRKALRAVQVFGIRQCYPLVLASHQLKSSDRDTVLNWMVTVLLRYSIIGEKGTGNLETLYARTSVEVRRKPYKSNVVRSLFADLCPSDDEFKVNFQEKTLSKADLVKYVLSSIENSRAGNDELTVDTDNLTIEHILPKSPLGAWGSRWQRGQPDHTLWLNRIGNLTLLSSPVNDAVANDAFAQKKVEYAKSNLSISREIATEPAWTNVEIESRQERLASDAVKVWRL